MRKLKNAFSVACFILFCASPQLFGNTFQNQSIRFSVATSLVNADALTNVYKQIYGKQLGFQTVPATENIESTAPATEPAKSKLVPTTDYFGGKNGIGQVSISKEPVPMTVYEMHKKMARIDVVFHVKKEVLSMIEALNLKRPDDHKDYLDPNPISTDCGIPIGKGRIVTAKHVTNDKVLAAYMYEKYGYNGQWHDGYEIIAYFRVGHEFRGVPMVKEKEDDKDRLVLKINMAAFWNTIRQSPPEEQEILKSIFYLLMVGVETADAEVDQIVYLAGWREAPIDMGGDRIRKYYAPYIFTGKISTKILDQYSIAQSVEPGYSGGMMITADGKVAGMLLWISAGRQFTGAIKIDDLMPKK